MGELSIFWSQELSNIQSIVSKYKVSFSDGVAKAFEILEVNYRKYNRVDKKLFYWNLKRALINLYNNYRNKEKNFEEIAPIKNHHEEWCPYKNTEVKDLLSSLSNESKTIVRIIFAERIEISSLKRSDAKRYKQQLEKHLISRNWKRPTIKKCFQEIKELFR